MLSSDEDDIDEEGQEYMENLQRKAASAATTAGLQMASTIEDDDEDDDSDSDYEPNEETILETFTTPLDEEECDIDEYIVFKEVMQRKPRNSYL